MDLITKAGPAQAIPESRWLKNWGSNPGRISSRLARRATTVAEDKMHEAPKMGLSRNADTRKR